MRSYVPGAILLLLLVVPSVRQEAGPILMGGAYFFFWLETQRLGDVCRSSEQYARPRAREAATPGRR